MMEAGQVRSSSLFSCTKIDEEQVYQTVCMFTVYHQREQDRSAHRIDALLDERQRLRGDIER